MANINPVLRNKNYRTIPAILFKCKINRTKQIVTSVFQFRSVFPRQYWASLDDLFLQRGLKAYFWFS